MSRTYADASRKDGSRLGEYKGGSVSEDINVVALVKGEERYIFLFNDENRGEALRTLGRYASNGELSFSWYDAAVLSQKIRSTPRKTSASTETSGGRFQLPPIEDLFSGEEPMV